MSYKLSLNNEEFIKLLELLYLIRINQNYRTFQKLIIDKT